MSNIDLVNEFCRVLLESPMTTMQAVTLRLSMTDYELKLLKADPCKEHYLARDAQKHFPFATGEKGIDW